MRKSRRQQQMRESGTLTNATRDVETFVVSDRMADQLINIIIPALRYDAAGTKKKGVFVVATYGTGKTHLMSTIGGVAEYAALRDSLQHPAVAQAAQPIAVGHARYHREHVDSRATRRIALAAFHDRRQPSLGAASLVER
jgi:Family of unknown function (DUF6079)